MRRFLHVIPARDPPVVNKCCHKQHKQGGLVRSTGRQRSACGGYIPPGAEWGGGWMDGAASGRSSHPPGWQLRQPSLCSLGQRVATAAASSGLNFDPSRRRASERERGREGGERRLEMLRCSAHTSVAWSRDASGCSESGGVGTEPARSSQGVQCGRKPVQRLWCSGHCLKSRPS